MYDWSAGTSRHGGEDAVEARARFRSAVDNTEVIVVRAPAEDVDLRCRRSSCDRPHGGASGRHGAQAAHAGGTQVGKRYVDGTATLEVLCTKAGDGGPLRR